MRVLVTGKGGVGKTTVSAALVSALAKAGADVVALDADGSPNLALSLGAGEPEDLPAVANEVPPRRDDSCDSDRFEAPSLLQTFAVAPQPNVRLVQAGRIERPSSRCLCCGSHATARRVLEALTDEGDQVVLADLEPGVNDLLWAKPRPTDVVIAVTDASRKAREVARRILAVADELGVTHQIVVANKLREGEAELIHREFIDSDVLEIGYQPDLDGVVPTGDSLGAVAELVGKLHEH